MGKVHEWDTAMITEYKPTGNLLCNHWDTVMKTVAIVLNESEDKTSVSSLFIALKSKLSIDHIDGE